MNAITGVVQALAAANGPVPGGVPAAGEAKHGPLDFLAALTALLGLPGLNPALPLSVVEGGLAPLPDVERGGQEGPAAPEGTEAPRSGAGPKDRHAAARLVPAAGPFLSALLDRMPDTAAQPPIAPTPPTGAAHQGPPAAVPVADAAPGPLPADVPPAPVLPARSDAPEQPARTPTPARQFPAPIRMLSRDPGARITPAATPTTLPVSLATPPAFSHDGPAPRVVPEQWRFAPVAGAVEVAAATPAAPPRIREAAPDSLPLAPAAPHVLPDGVRSAAPQAPAPVHEQVAAEIVTRAHLVQRDRASEFTLELQPPELGHVKVQLSTSREGLTAHLQVADEAARLLVVGQLDQLRQRLADAACPVVSFSVSDWTGQRHQPGRQQGNEHTPGRRDGWRGQAAAGLPRSSNDPPRGLDVVA